MQNDAMLYAVVQCGKVTCAHSVQD